MPIEPWWETNPATTPRQELGMVSPELPGRSLSDEQADHIQRLLRTHGPEELGIAAPLWTSRAVADLIRQEYGISLAVRTVGLYLEALGLHGQAAAPPGSESGPRGSAPIWEGKGDGEGKGNITDIDRLRGEGASRTRT